MCAYTCVYVCASRRRESSRINRAATEREGGSLRGLILGGIVRA